MRIPPQVNCQLIIFPLGNPTPFGDWFSRSFSEEKGRIYNRLYLFCPPFMGEQKYKNYANPFWINPRRFRAT